MTEQKKCCQSKDDEKRHINRVLTFCGARNGRQENYREVARKVGRLLADEGYCESIYGGGSSGLMGEFAAGAYDGGARVTAIVPKAYIESNGYQNPAFEHVEVNTLFNRKEEMFFRADACIALPGGFGTWDEIMTFAACNDEDRHVAPDRLVVPIIIINTDGYYDGITMQMQRGLQDGFIDAGQCQMIHIVNTAEEAVQILNELNAAGPMPASQLNNKNVPVAAVLVPPQKTPASGGFTPG